MSLSTSYSQTCKFRVSVERNNIYRRFLRNSSFYSLIALHIFFAAAAAKSLQSCLTLCDPIDGSPPGSPIPGILQAIILEWVAISR